MHRHLIRFYLFAFLCIFYCVSCKTFHDRSGKKFHQFALANDYSGAYFANKSAQAIHEFSFEKWDDTSTEEQAYLTREAFDKLKARYGTFVVLYWNAGCPEDRTDTLVRDLVSGNVTVILATYNFNLAPGRKKVRESKLKNKTLYVLSPEKKTDKSILRILYFTREVCPACYDTYRDELVYANGVLCENGKVQVLFYKDLGNIASRISKSK